MGGRTGRGALTLSIDIGGSGLKAAVLDLRGRPTTDRVRVPTPADRTPRTIVRTLRALVRPLAPYDRVSVGFPGAVRNGVILTAPNLDGAAWRGVPLARTLTRALGAPTRVANDADVQGLGAVRGRGLEVVVTLGTGFGTGMYVDGHLAPHLEIGQSRFRKGESYDEQLGNAARKRIGNARWNARLAKAIRTLHRLTNYDHLYIGGGNAKHVTVGDDPTISLVSNRAGILGGIALWRD